MSTHEPVSHIAERRAAVGLSQYAAAKAVGIGQSHLRKIETGVVVPRVDIAIRLASALGSSVEKLFKVAA